MKATGGPPVAGWPPDVLRHLVAALPRQWRRYCKRLKRCQRRFSESAVHDSRVETRRLLALLELLTAYLPARALEKPRYWLKQHLEVFDHLRDTQVQLRTVAPLRRTFPASKKFHRWLCQREARFIREAGRAVKQIKTRRAGKKIATFEVELRRLRKHTAPETTWRLAQNAIRLAFTRVGRLYRRVKATDLGTIHRTRIAFKRFRYMVEALSPLLPAVTNKHREAMRGYQTMMGEVQDMRVLLTALDKFLEQEDNDSRVQPLRAEFVRQRAHLVQVYIRAIPKLESFWPPKMRSPLSDPDEPDQPHESIYPAPRPGR